MFEHVRSRNPILGFALDLMTLWTRLFGTEMNRDTLANARAAGFVNTHVEYVYLDVILAVRASKPPHERLLKNDTGASRAPADAPFDAGSSPTPSPPDKGLLE